MPNFATCPICNGTIEMNGADPGVDATGAAAGQEFVPQSTAGWQKKKDLGRLIKKLYVPQTVEVLYQGERVLFPGGRVIGPFYTEDDSIDAAYYKQNPPSNCAGRGLPA